MSKTLGKLFEPVEIGKLKLKNRLVMCPMGTGLADRAGTVNQRMIDYYTARAKGGASLIIVESSMVESKLGIVGLFTRVFIDHDRFIPGLSKLARSIHEHGARAAIQLQHAGLWANCPAGEPPVSASSIAVRPGLVSRALTRDEIAGIVAAFAGAARRAREAGFDAVDLNGGAGLLIAQFLSPATNQRTDAYGGDFEGRMRFALEIIQAIRARAGEDFPIVFDHPADEFIPGGIDRETGKLIARRIDSAGVEALRIHTGVHDPRYMHWIIPPAAIPPAFQVPYAVETRKVVKQARIMVGRLLDDLPVANGVLEQGGADIIVLGRSLLADPELPNKAAAGKLAEIRRCLRCNQCVHRPDPAKWSLSC
ncbi:MAG: NADH:flavin oxidoreductase, partial [Kiritimatiellota bacterium]|nr:NADH:flavin oxidoreductase [Kiritimatiellota bacterium]